MQGKNHLRFSFVLGFVLLVIVRPTRAEPYVVDLETSAAISMFIKTKNSGSQVLRIDVNPAEAAKIAARGITIEPVQKFRIMGEKTAGGKLTKVGSRKSFEEFASQIQWAATAMDVPKAHALSNSQGAGQKICLVDTGVDKTHKLLKDKILSATSRVPLAVVEDKNGHGTHVASLMVGSTDLGSPAPAAKVISVKALDDNGFGETDWIAKAIEDCVSNKADIINLSVGAPQPSEILRLAIQRAKSAGLIVVAATGNDGGAVNYPAAYPEVIGVGAIDPDKRIPSFSCRGTGTTFVAPGVAIAGAKIGGGIINMTGTSMAAPFVSGMMALKNSRKSDGIVAKDLGFDRLVQGKGLVNAHETATNK